MRALPGALGMRALPGALGMRALPGALKNAQAFSIALHMQRA